MCQQTFCLPPNHGIVFSQINLYLKNGLAYYIETLYDTKRHLQTNCAIFSKWLPTIFRHFRQRQSVVLHSVL